jgi:hypothetical protein
MRCRTVQAPSIFPQVLQPVGIELATQLDKIERPTVPASSRILRRTGLGVRLGSRENSSTGFFLEPGLDDSSQVETWSRESAEGVQENEHYGKRGKSFKASGGQADYGFPSVAVAGGRDVC